MVRNLIPPSFSHLNDRRKMEKVRGASNCRICISLLLMVVLNFYYGQIREVQMPVKLSRPVGVQPRIAVRIQGPADYLYRWRDFLSLMSTRSEVDYFCLIYDGTVNETMVAASSERDYDQFNDYMDYRAKCASSGNVYRGGQTFQTV